MPVVNPNPSVSCSVLSVACTNTLGVVRVNPSDIGSCTGISKLNFCEPSILLKTPCLSGGNPASICSATISGAPTKDVECVIPNASAHSYIFLLSLTPPSIVTESNHTLGQT